MSPVVSVTATAYLINANYGKGRATTYTLTAIRPVERNSPALRIRLDPHQFDV
jgi:hypothetical protein